MYLGLVLRPVRGGALVTVAVLVLLTALVVLVLLTALVVLFVRMKAGVPMSGIIGAGVPMTVIIGAGECWCLEDCPVQCLNMVAHLVQSTYVNI